MFALFLLAVVLGVWPVPEIASHIPVIRSGNHLRVVFIMMLCLALLGGWPDARASASRSAASA